VKSLQDVIRRQIVSRVAGVIAILVLLNLSFSTYEALRLVEDLKKSLRAELVELENFVIGQVLVDNEESIPERLEVFKDRHPELTIQWNHSANLDLEGFRWHFPDRFQWEVPLRSIGSQRFGSIFIDGSYFAFESALHEFGRRTVFLVIVTILILSLLVPLVNVVPNRFFMQPIHRTLALLEGKESPEDLASAPEVQEVYDIQMRIQSLLKEIELKSREAAVSEVASRVAHDIRSPVGAILMTISDDSVLDADAKKILKASALRVQAISSQLLKEYAEPTSSWTQNFRQLVEALIKTIRAEFSGHEPTKVDLQMDDVSAQLPPSPHILELIQVCSNLLKNAFEAVDPDTGVIDVKISVRNQNVNLEVTDNGKGMPQEILVKLGTDVITHGKGGSGTGLGILRSQQSIRMRGGSLMVESEQGRGTRVLVVLPLTESISQKGN
jgi:signal transduction histidine kinase